MADKAKEVPACRIIARNTEIDWAPWHANLEPGEIMPFNFTTYQTFDRMTVMTDNHNINVKVYLKNGDVRRFENADNATVMDNGAVVVFEGVKTTTIAPGEWITIDTDVEPKVKP